MTPAYKRCTKCGQVKPADQFFMRTDIDALQSHCKACIRAANNQTQRTSKVEMIGIIPDLPEMTAEDLAPFVGGTLPRYDFNLTLHARAFASGLVVIIDGQRRVTRGDRLEPYDGPIVRNVAL